MLKTKRNIRINIKWSDGIEMSTTTMVCGMNNEAGRTALNSPSQRFVKEDQRRRRRRREKEEKMLKMFKNDFDHFHLWFRSTHWDCQICIHQTKHHEFDSNLYKYCNLSSHKILQIMQKYVRRHYDYSDSFLVAVVI